MSRLNHTFNVEHAEKYGIECAILIHHFQFWIEQNQALGRNFIDGKTWTYQTQKEISVIYPYMSEDSVQRSIKKLVDEDVLITANYNKSQLNKTLWYAFKNEKMFTKPQNCGMDAAKLRNANRKIAEYIMTDTNHTDTKQQQQEASPPSAAASSQKTNKKQDKPKEKPSKTLPCLENIPIDDKVKRFLSEQFDTPTIEKAVKAYLSQADNVSNPAAWIRSACREGYEPRKDKEKQVIENRHHAEKVIALANIPSNVYVELLNLEIEIGFIGANATPTTLKYDVSGFAIKLEKILEKYRIMI